MMIRSFDDFTAALLEAGFSIGGGNDEGIYSVSRMFGPNIVYHTGDPETDPWEWRMRVLEERNDIAGAKLFFRKTGWITREWYPYFLAARRGGRTFDDAYADGTVSRNAKRIYDCVNANGAVAFHTIKQLAGFGREDQSRFERALVELQAGMYLTMCGRQRKVSGMGMEYGWFSTVFCTAERFFGGEVFERAARLSGREAAEKITERVYRLNPGAEARQINKFIKG